MEKLTKKEAVRLHREMWRIISEMSDEEIEEALNGRNSVSSIKRFALIKMQSNGIHYRFKGDLLCFCCEYGHNSNNCKSCPVKWKNERCYLSEYEEFCHFIHTKRYNESRTVAKEISELPEREDIDDETK